MSETARYALGYASRRWSVVPVHSVLELDDPFETVVVAVVAGGVRVGRPSLEVLVLQTA